MRICSSSVGQWKQSAAYGIGVELVPLPAPVVGVEHEPALVDAAQQHDADRGPAVGVGGGKRDRRGVDVVRGGALDGDLELDEGVVVEHV